MNEVRMEDLKRVANAWLAVPEGDLRDEAEIDLECMLLGWDIIDEDEFIESITKSDLTKAVCVVTTGVWNMGALLSNPKTIVIDATTGIHNVVEIMP